MTTVDIYFCGGSQIAGMGLSMTQSLPVLVTRALRAAWGDQLGHSHMLAYSGDPRDLKQQIAARGPRRPFVLVYFPRHVYVWGVPQLGDLRRFFPRVAALDAAVVGNRAVAVVEARERGVGEVHGHTASLAPASVAVAAPAAHGATRATLRRRAWLATRWTTKVLWYLAWLPTLPLWMLRYDRALRSLLRFCRAAGCRLVVLTTPVPLARVQPWTPGLHWYVAALAQFLRAKASHHVVVADLFRELAAPSDEPLYVAHDGMIHLTASGTQTAAATVVRATLDGADRLRLLAAAR
jgi:hypothetical protein